VRRLAIRPGGIGDFIVSLPALECLKTDDYEIWTRSETLPLVQFADRVRSIASTGLDLLSVAEPPPRLIEELRGFDSIVSWYGANRPEFRAETERLRLPFTFFPAIPPEGAGVHAADFYLAQARTIGPCASDGIPRIRCPQRPGDERAEDYAVIHPFSGSERKNWPLENFGQLARRLSMAMRVYWCYGPNDPPEDEAVRIDNLYDLACWIAKASLFVGNDSGITHLAAAVGTPVLALFGPTDPAVWAPRGEHVKIGRF
jgi:heptosyltransferase III